MYPEEQLSHKAWCACLQNVSDCGQEIVELQESQENLAERLTRQKQQLERLCDTSYTLERDYVNLQDTRDRVRSTYTLHMLLCFKKAVFSQFLFMLYTGLYSRSG